MDSTFPPAVQEALHGIPNWEESQMKVLARFSGAFLGVPAFVEKPIDYRRSEIVIFCMDNEYRVVEQSKDHVYRISLFISDMGPLFSFIARRKTVVTQENSKRLGTSGPGICLMPLAEIDWPTEITAFVEKVSLRLSEDGLTRLVGPILQRVVEGFRTELDDKPATLFEILFSEID